MAAVCVGSNVVAGSGRKGHAYSSGISFGMDTTRVGLAELNVTRVGLRIQSPGYVSCFNSARIHTGEYRAFHLIDVYASGIRFGVNVRTYIPDVDSTRVRFAVYNSADARHFYAPGIRART